MKSITKRVATPSGAYWMDKKESWGKVYYSFDSGDSWHTSKKAAFEVANKAGKLWSV